MRRAVDPLTVTHGDGVGRQQRLVCALPITGTIRNPRKCRGFVYRAVTLDWRVGTELDGCVERLTSPRLPSRLMARDRDEVEVSVNLRRDRVSAGWAHHVVELVEAVSRGLGEIARIGKCLRP